MGLFSKKKKEETPYKEIMKYHGKSISSAVERAGGEEITLGKKGGISITDSEISVVCDGSQVFRCLTKGAVVCTLMSGNGCDIKGFDSQTNKRRHVICYYARISN